MGGPAGKQNKSALPELRTLAAVRSGITFSQVLPLSCYHSAQARKGEKDMKATKDRHGAGGSMVPFLTVIRLDYAEPGAVHFVATDGGSLYEILVIVPEGAKIDISPNKIGFNELTGATVKVTGYETDKLDGVYISGHGIRVIYSHEYTNRTFAEAETDMLLNAGEIAG